MRLFELIDEELQLKGSGEVEIIGLTADSRDLRPGDLFAALPGSHTDGRRFVPEALAKGAAALLGDAALAEAGAEVPVLVAADPRRALARVAARFHKSQPPVVAAVTGTSGKTSIASFTRQLWGLLDHAAASVGTLGVVAPGLERPSALTTPDPASLHRTLAELARRGVSHVAIEASSHALDQRRLDGVRLWAAAFTNLSRDHFDYHGSAEAYLAAKQRLFAELLPAGGTAVLNADVPEFPALLAIARERGLAVIDYGRTGRRLRLVEHAADAHEQRLELALDGRAWTVASPLVGSFMGLNLLAALGLVLACGAEAETVLPLLGAVRGARGRMELVGHHPAGAPVFVDYAHKPAALENSLVALRPLAAGRLMVLFGCGGDRDPGKRPLMGEIAVRLADRVYVTDDNPRTEQPAVIRRAILEGAPGALEIGDRGAAIRAAVGELRRGDVLLVAGKGHETGQYVGDRVLPFDDAAVVRAALAALETAA